MDLNGNTCPYCNTPYKTYHAKFDRYDIDFNYKTILSMIDGNVVSVNMARKMLGLKEISR